MIKKILLTVGLLAALVSSAFAETATVTLSGGSTTNVIIRGPGKLNGISISSLATTNGVISFWDSAFNTNTYTRGGWTNITYSSALTTNIYTNIFGVITTNQYTAKVWTTNTIAAGVVARPQLTSLTTVSNAIVSQDFDGTFFGTGLMITNIVTLGGLGGVTITVNYDKLF